MKLLTPAQATAAHDAMCAMNNVSGSGTLIFDEVSVTFCDTGVVTVSHRSEYVTGFGSQTAFALYFGVPGVTA
jgi:hypothetical protein